MLALPWRRPGCPPLCVALPKGEDQVGPRVNKLACCPALTNMGWRRRGGATGTAAKEEGGGGGGIPHPQGEGGLCATKATPRERLTGTACEKTCENSQ